MEASATVTATVRCPARLCSKTTSHHKTSLFSSPGFHEFPSVKFNKKQPTQILKLACRDPNRSSCCYASLKQSNTNVGIGLKRHAVQDISLKPKSGGQTSLKFMATDQFFNPENMSAQAKLNIELKKVREQFKMHEGDCGSARVQVAQMALKIRYLSKTIHKKDNQSRRGLQLMVGKWRKMLKYLRRTDWESYCLVRDKLGLKDSVAAKGRKYK